MEVALLVVLISLSNLICLIVGAKIGGKAYRGEEIKLPNPMEKAKVIKVTKEHNEEQKNMDTMLYNIDVYDGTGLGQKDL